MVIINSQKFVSYKLDTLQSFSNRVAYNLGTTSNYLYYEDGVPKEIKVGDENLGDVEDIFYSIINEEYEINFVKLYENIKDKLKQQNLDLDIVKNVIEPFIAYNKALENTDKHYIAVTIYSIKLNIMNRYPDLLPDNIDLEKIWERKDMIKSDRESDVNFIIKKVKKLDKILIGYKSITNSVKYTKFNTEKIVTEFMFKDMERTSILEVFNMIKLTPEVPFAASSGYYKISKNYIPSEDWDFSPDNSIMIRVFTKHDLNNINHEDFTEILVAKFGSKDDEDDEDDEDREDREDKKYLEGKMGVTFELEISNKSVSCKKLVERILGSFISDINTTPFQEVGVKGVFYFSKQRLNRKIFMDIVMNNPLFSMLMRINESDKATKHTLYIYFYHPSTGNIKATITEQISYRTSLVYKKYGAKLFPEKVPYLRLKTNADTLEKIVIFQKIFSKLLGEYNSQYKSIFDIYKNYIPEFTETEVELDLSIRDVKLKDLAPDVFTVGYPRLCNYKPTIISDEQADKERKKGKKGMQVMVFPKKDNPYNFVCEYELYKYPGVRINPLDNRKYDYVPCCYKNDQKKTINYTDYFNQKKSDKKEISHVKHGIINTNRLVNYGINGILPDELVKMFDIINVEDDYNYFRKGVHRSESSFLNCIIEVLDPNISKNELISEEYMFDYLIGERDRLDSLKSAWLSKQTLYDYSVDDIKNIIGGFEYFDPQHFIPLLEDEYNCNIFLFKRDKNGTAMVLPRHLKSFLKYESDKPCVLIYEHLGNNADYATYPQCELIVKKYKNTNKTTDVFDKTTDIFKYISSLYEDIRKSYVLNKKVGLTKILPYTPYEQGLDSFGKCQMIRLKYNDKKITLILENPIPPYNIKGVYAWDIIYAKVKNVINMFKNNIFGRITGQILNDDKNVVELVGQIGNTYFSIPVKSESKIDDIPIINHPCNYNKSTTSYLSSVNKYKKLARYISEYMFWLYSMYIYTENIIMDDNSIKNFIQKYVEIDPEYKYEYVFKKFSYDSSLMRNGKLVVKNLETIKRLVYVLRLEIIRNKPMLINYYTLVNINKYYLDITDFNTYSLQVIMEGDDSIKKWVKEQHHNSIIYNRVLPEASDSYFVKIPFINNDIYLAQNTDEIWKANSIMNAWFLDGYNPGKDGEGEIDDNADIVEFILYTYSSPEEITPYMISGTKWEYTSQVIGYSVKVDEENYKDMYTVLLPLKAN